MKREGNFDDIKAKVRDLIVCHQRRYPMMQIEDVYKLIYQSIMGPGHLLSDEKRAFAALKKEIANSPGREKDIFVDISLNIKLVRVNLNVFAKKSGYADKLFSAMKKTAVAIQPDKEKFQEVWETIGEMLLNRNLTIGNYAKWILLTDRLSRDSFPPIVHSSIYRRLYSPSYRVILYDLVDEILT
jgi:hypothetical protein